MNAKRFITGLLASIIALGLIGCGEVDESISTVKSTAANSAAAENGSSAETEKVTEESSTEVTDSLLQDSLPDDSVSEYGYDLGHSLLGMDRDSARALIKRIYPGTTETTDSFQTSEPVTVYIYEGDVSLLGERFNSMHFAVNDNTEKVISDAFVANSDNEDISLDDLYNTLLTKTKEQYGEGEYANIGDVELKNEYTLWSEGHVSLQYIHSDLSNAATLSLSFEDIPLNIASVTADDIEFFEQFPEKVYPCEYDAATEILISAFGNNAEISELGEFMNALSKRYYKNQFDYLGGVSVLGEKFYGFSVDFDADDKTVYTVGFHKNPDLNTSEDSDPSSSECKDSYDRLYTQLKEKYGEPVTTFTPEHNGFFGVLWTDTSCGEIWLAWGEKIFGSEQADCILSFSRKGVNGSPDAQ